MNQINTHKVLAMIWVGILFILGILQVVSPILPPVWANMVDSLLALLASYNLIQSHKPAVLNAAGWRKMN